MQGALVIDRDLFTGFYIAQREEKHVPVKSLHECIGLTGMVYVMSPVATSAAIDAVAAVNITDAENPPPPRAFPGFKIRDALAGVLGDLATTRKRDRSKAALTVDW